MYLLYRHIQSVHKKEEERCIILMAKLKTEDGQEMEVPDGEKIIKQCEDLGVPFACQNGVCRTCEIEVLEGMDNITPKTQEEIDMRLPEKHRLACQCKLKGGEIKIKF